MRWIASSEKHASEASYESRLWQCVEHLRSNSDLKAAEYFQPVLGLIFLRFAEIQRQVFGLERKRPFHVRPAFGY
jgi:type I restriction enzyme M protein